MLRPSAAPQLPNLYVLFFSRPRPEGWPHHGRAFSIYLCFLSFWMSLPRGVLTSRLSGLSRLRAPGIVFLHYLFIPCFLMAWPWYMLASLHWQCLTYRSLFTPALSRTHLSKPAKQVWYWALRVYWEQFRVYVCVYVCMYVIKLLPNDWTDSHKNYTSK